MGHFPGFSSKYVSVLYISSVNRILTPEENQSPLGVGVTRDLMPSTIDTAVDAAEDLPHFWMSTPPRCKSIFLFSNLELHVE